MNVARSLYNRLSQLIQPTARRIYKTLHPDKMTNARIQSEFENQFFDSSAAYERYASEFEEGPAADIWDKALCQCVQFDDSEQLVALTGKNSRDDRLLK